MKFHGLLITLKKNFSKIPAKKFQVFRFKIVWFWPKSAGVYFTCHERVELIIRCSSNSTFTFIIFDQIFLPHFYNFQILPHFYHFLTTPWRYSLNPYLGHFGNVVEHHLWTKNPQSFFSNWWRHTWHFFHDYSKLG